MIKKQLPYLNKRKIKATPVYEDRNGRNVKVSEYLVCDNCGKQIDMSVPKSQRIGGTMRLSAIMTKFSKDVEIVCCNSCVNKVIKEFESASEASYYG